MFYSRWQIEWQSVLSIHLHTSSYNYHDLLMPNFSTCPESCLWFKDCNLSITAVMMGHRIQGFYCRWWDLHISGYRVFIVKILFISDTLSPPGMSWNLLQGTSECQPRPDTIPSSSLLKFKPCQLYFVLTSHKFISTSCCISFKLNTAY